MGFIKCTIKNEKLNQIMQSIKDEGIFLLYFFQLFLKGKTTESYFSAEIVAQMLCR